MSAITGTDDAPGVHQVKLVRIQSGILGQRSVYWVAIYAPNFLSACKQVLSQPGRDQAFANASFSLHHEVDGPSRFGILDLRGI
jgi:hypothetical protein